MNVTTMNKKYEKPELTIVNIEYDKQLLAASDPVMSIAGDDETPGEGVVEKDGDIYLGAAKSTTGSFWDDEE